MIVRGSARMRAARAVVGLAVAAVLAGCAGGTATGSATQTATAEPTPTPTPTSDFGECPEDMFAPVQALVTEEIVFLEWSETTIMQQGADLPLPSCVTGVSGSDNDYAAFYLGAERELADEIAAELAGFLPEMDERSTFEQRLWGSTEAAYIVLRVTGPDDRNTIWSILLDEPAVILEVVGWEFD